MSDTASVLTLMRGDPSADRIVPRTGQSARLTVAVAGAMSFLAVFALALSMAAGRLADRWDASLAQTATIRLSAPATEIDAQTERVLTVLSQTRGIASARALTTEEQQALLEPWLGPDLPLDDLPIPRLIEITEDLDGFDAGGLRQRLAAEAPGAVLDDHTRWREPLVNAADRLRLLGGLALLLLFSSMAAMVTLAAQAALAANTPIIGTLRLIGAQDSYIARAFVRRFTLRALAGATIGAACGTVGMALLPRAAAEGAFLTGLGFQGDGWLLPLALPPLAAFIAFWATRFAAFQTLKGMR